jgi:hypothetical protein
MVLLSVSFQVGTNSRRPACGVRAIIDQSQPRNANALCTWVPGQLLVLACACTRVRTNCITHQSVICGALSAMMLELFYY